MGWGIAADARKDQTSGKWFSAPLHRAKAAPAGQMRPCTERTFHTWDGSALFYRQWPAREPARNAVILIHRGHEHSGRLQELVDRLNLPACAIFA